MTCPEPSNRQTAASPSGQYVQVWKWFEESELCACSTHCGDDGDTDGPGTCKGLPRQPEPPLVEIVLVPR